MVVNISSDKEQDERRQEAEVRVNHVWGNSFGEISFSRLPDNGRFYTIENTRMYAGESLGIQPIKG